MSDAAPTDPDLLAAWLKSRHEASFHALVGRYAGLVHAAAKRTCGDDSLAAEASQLTFILLARKAAGLAGRASLAGWLHLTAVRQTQDLLRQSRREHAKRDRLAMNFPSPSADDTWRDLQPMIDDALAALSAKDREALLLRFYRTLTVREVGATLGIATDAAQKRIDRATERLRGQLLRRGCQSGASLGGAMLAGFTADAQAATTAVSAIASKAIAAGAAGGGVGASVTIFLTTTAMKTTSLAIPLVALCVAGAWLVSQRQSIAELRRESAVLREQLAAPLAMSMPVRKVTQGISALDQKPIDWEEVARQLSDSSLAARLKEQLAALDADELDASLDEITKAEMSNKHRDLLQRHLGVLLLEKDAERGLSKFIDRVHDEGSNPFNGTLESFLAKWARKDPQAATAWFDAHIAAGDFDGRDLKRSNYIRVRFEHAVIYALVSSDPEAAGRRLGAFPKDQRFGILQGVGAGRSLGESDYLPFARMLREYLPDKERLGVLTWPVSQLGEGGTVEYAELRAYLARIEARPDERETCILAVAASTFPRKSGSFFLTTSEDLVALRTWVGSEVPELTARATGAAIRGLLRNFDYPMVAGIALHLRETGSGDEVLLPLLEDYKDPENKELARSIAAKLADEKRRADHLEQFK